MKTRSGFVSNSSSSSFIIKKEYITPFQIYCIKNHRDIAKDLKLDCADWDWLISETEDTVSGSTTLDNFNMYEFLTRVINIYEGLIRWDSDEN